MKNLKDLTPEECVAIAKIINPNVDWKFTISKYKWSGFDIVDDEESPSKIVQIDYTERSCFENKIKYFINLNQRHIPFEILNEIHTYLNSLDSKEIQNKVRLELLGYTYFEKTNNTGDLCCFLLEIVRKDNEEPVLILKRKTSTKTKELFENDGSWELIEQNNDGYVFQQYFSIKLSTLTEINNWVESLKLF